MNFNPGGASPFHWQQAMGLYEAISNAEKKAKLMAEVSAEILKADEISKAAFQSQAKADADTEKANELMIDAVSAKAKASLALADAEAKARAASEQHRFADASAKAAAQERVKLESDKAQATAFFAEAQAKAVSDRSEIDAQRATVASLKAEYEEKLAGLKKLVG
jgi:hypothetical protein